MRLKELSYLDCNYNIIRDCEFDLLGMSTTEYENENVLSFLCDINFLPAVLNNKNIKGIICDEKFISNIKDNTNIGILKSNNAKMDFYKIHNELCSKEFYWKKFDNKISRTANISKNAYIADDSIVIGDNTIIEDGVVIHQGTIIGNNVIIRSGTQLGCNGFQFLNTNNTVIPVQSGGRLLIHDNVEIQHNSCIGKGVFGGYTVIGDSVKIDDLVYIAHDVKIGDRTLITAGTKIGGRVVIGKDCFFGFNATVSNGLKIGNNSKISLGSVVTKNVDSNITVSGNFAIEHNKFIDFIKSIR